MKTKGLFAATLSIAALILCPAVMADEVTEWNDNMFQAILTAKVGAAPSSRLAASQRHDLFRRETAR